MSGDKTFTRVTYTVLGSRARGDQPDLDRGKVKDPASFWRISSSHRGALYRWVKICTSQFARRDHWTNQATRWPAHASISSMSMFYYTTLYYWSNMEYTTADKPVSYSGSASSSSSSCYQPPPRRLKGNSEWPVRMVHGTGACSGPQEEHRGVRVLGNVSIKCQLWLECKVRLTHLWLFPVLRHIKWIEDDQIEFLSQRSFSVSSVSSLETSSTTYRISYYHNMYLFRSLLNDVGIGGKEGGGVCNLKKNYQC